MSAHSPSNASSEQALADHRTRQAIMRSPNQRSPSPSTSLFRVSDAELGEGTYCDEDAFAFGTHRSELPEQATFGSTPTWRDYVNPQAMSRLENPGFDSAATRRPSSFGRQHHDTQRSFRHSLRGVTDLQSTRNRSVSGHSINAPDRTLRPTSVQTQSSHHQVQPLCHYPRWQPDEEIDKCPICGTSFTFWYRKHHCRKCGRVVCAGCSPHRITIPRQFIVHPPEMQNSSKPRPGPSSQEVIDLTVDDDVQASAGRASPIDHPQIDCSGEGGEEVRLCNPCVPDPNPMPHDPGPSPYSRRTSAHSDHPGFSRNSHYPVSTRPHPISPFAPDRSSYRLRRDGNRFGSSLPFPPGMETLAGTSSRRFETNDMTHHAGLGNRMLLRPDDSRFSAQSSRPLGLSHPRHRYHASLGHAPVSSQPFDSFDLLFSDREARPLFPPSQPRQQLNEEDECPVCHLALPPKDPDGSEATREQHIAACIDAHSSGSVRAGTHTSAVGANAIPSSTDHGDATAGETRAAISSSVPERVLAVGSMPRRQTTGMVVYNATEKDCVGADGETDAECVICFEEFVVGHEMGRLECLCKFHHRCIRQWWSTKGPGVCPVHQQSS